MKPIYTAALASVMLGVTLPCAAVPITPVIHRSGDAIGIMPLTSVPDQEKPRLAASADKVTVQVGVKTDNSRNQEARDYFRTAGRL